MMIDGAPLKEEKQSQEIGERQDPDAALSCVPCRADGGWEQASLGSSLRLSSTGGSPGQGHLC